MFIFETVEAVLFIFILLFFPVSIDSFQVSKAQWDAKADYMVFLVFMLSFTVMDEKGRQYVV